VGETPVSEEQILVMPAQRLHSLGYFTGFTVEVERYLPALLKREYLSFRPRREMETDPTWLQLIPYMVLQHEGSVFHYTRGSSGGEKRLHALKSIGIGGHINPVDDETTDPYRAGMIRELDEEVQNVGDFSDRILGLVHDPSTPVGQVHLGVVHLLKLEHRTVRPRESGLTDCGFASVSELLQQSDQFESWSQLVFQSLK
jgi:predicted NUDIX family phosphoesterase